MSTVIVGKTTIDDVVNIDKGGGTLRSAPVYDEKGNLLVITEDKWSMIIELQENIVNDDSGRYYMMIDGYGLFKLMDDRSYLYRVINLPISDINYKIIHGGMSYKGHAFWLITHDTEHGYRLWFYDREYRQLTQGSSSINELLNEDGSLPLTSINFYNIQYNNIQRHVAIIPANTLTQYSYIIIGNLMYLQMKMEFSATYSENTIPLTNIACNVKRIQSINDGKMYIGDYISTNAPSPTETLNGEYITSLPYENNGAILTSKRTWYQPSSVILYNATEFTSYTLWLYTGTNQSQDITETAVFKEFHKNQYTRAYGRFTSWIVNEGNILFGSSAELDGYTTINLMDTGIPGNNTYICTISAECSSPDGYSTPTFSANMTADDINAALKNAKSYYISLAVITDNAFYRITFTHPKYYKHGNTSYTRLSPTISVYKVLDFSSDIGIIKSGFNNTTFNENTLGVFTNKGVITIDITSPTDYIFQPLYYINNAFISSSIHWTYWGLIRIPTEFISTINGAVPIVMNVQGEINSSNINAYTQYFHKCMVLINDIQKRLAQLEAKS